MTGPQQEAKSITDGDKNPSLMVCPGVGKFVVVKDQEIFVAVLVTCSLCHNQPEPTPRAWA